MTSQYINNLKGLLLKLSVIEYKHNTLAENREQFNVFSALYRENDERRLHSRFLSVLLSPKSSHKKGGIFLEKLLQVLEIDDFDVISVEVYPNEQDKKEYKNIDILILNNKSKKAIIIENKIDSGDSNHQQKEDDIEEGEDSGQLARYFNRVHKDFEIPKENINVYYLTPNRREPSLESLGRYQTLENINCKAIDYEHEIIDWLDLCLQECVNQPYLRESILQYKDLINRMTNNIDIAERLEIRDLIGSSDENIKSAVFLAENFKHVKWHTAWDFWTELAKALEENDFDVISRPTEKQITNITHFDTYKSGYYKNTWYGIHLKTRNGLKLYIWQEAWNKEQDYGIYWGITKEELSKKEDEDLRSFVGQNPSYFEKSEDDYWKDFDFINNESQNTIKFYDFSNPGTYKLINKGYRTEIIDKMVKEIKDFITRIEVKIL